MTDVRGRLRCWHSTDRTTGACTRCGEPTNLPSPPPPSDEVRRLVDNILGDDPFGINDPFRTKGGRT